MKAVTPKVSLLPQSIVNLIESANVCTRIILATAQGTERAVDGIDQVATTMLRQQKERLLIELTPE